MLILKGAKSEKHIQLLDNYIILLSTRLKKFRRYKIRKEILKINNKFNEQEYENEKGIIFND